MTPPSPIAVSDVHKRVVRVLAVAQVFGGIGVAAGAAVGALLAADLASESLSGVSSAASVIGAALIAIPVTRVMNEHGRRPGLMLAYAIGILGALLVVTGAAIRVFPLALLGLLMAGGGTTATLQSRYAATDLATPAHRSRALSTVVWATTVGSVLGPNLADPMGNLAERIGIPRLAGPYLLTVIVYMLSAALVWLMLRPDPLLVARELDASRTGASGPPARGSMRDSLQLITANPVALLGLVSVVVGHVVMVAVMSMTPVHLQHGDASLKIIGFVISGHITGMYVASPLVGVASDRYGRRPVILAGGIILLTAFIIAGTASGHESIQLAIGLAMLGLGWSCTLIAGSTLLTESVPISSRPGVQGTSDMVMGIAGASAGLLSGVVVGFGSYALLNVLTTLLVLPLMAFTLRPRRQLASA